MSTVACLPCGGQLAERLGRGGHAVAHPAALDHGMVGPALQNLAVQRSDHRFVFSAASPDASAQFAFAVRRSQALSGTRGRSPAARASAAWSDFGGSGSESSAPTMRWTWSLPARPAARTRPASPPGAYRRSTGCRARPRSRARPRAPAPPRTRCARCGRSRPPRSRAHRERARRAARRCWPRSPPAAAPPATPAAVEITPPQTVLRRCACDSTMPKPVEAVPGSMPSTLIGRCFITGGSFCAHADVPFEASAPSAPRPAAGRGRAT